MSETTRPYNKIDDYIAVFSDEERQEYVAAETALDLACMLDRIRQCGGKDFAFSCVRSKQEQVSFFGSADLPLFQGQMRSF